MILSLPYRNIIIVLFLFLQSCNQDTAKEELYTLNKQGVKYSSTNVDSALYYFDKVITLDSNYFLSYQNKANLLIKIKAYKSALKVVDELSLRLENSDIYQMKGILNDLNRDSTLARENYLKAISQIDTEVKRVNDFVKYKKLYEKGMLYLLLNRTDEGLALIKQYSKKTNISDARMDSIVHFQNNREELLHIAINP